MSISRRQFIERASAASFGLPLLVSSRAWGANDEIRVGIVGLGIRGTGAHMPGMAVQKGVKIVAVCDPDRTRSAAAAKLCEEHYQQNGRSIRRRPQAAGPERNRRRLHCHPAILARPGHDLGLPGRQAHLRGKAGLALYLGRPADGQRGAALPAHRPVRHAAALEQAARGPRSTGSAAETWARSSSSPPLPTSPAFRWASGSSPCRSRPRSTTISGAVRPRSCPSTATSSSTIAASTGTPATANRPTKASTRSTSPAGSWAKRNCRGE